ncbi:hypothetical protein [Leifsonia sp. P73]|uniref:hypothetical protein n=1 Tax=Leifsonia sp. P73 TaxID=3423959 RepID=UPI003DA43250
MDVDPHRLRPRLVLPARLDRRQGEQERPVGVELFAADLQVHPGGGLADVELGHRVRDTAGGADQVKPVEREPLVPEMAHGEREGVVVAVTGEVEAGLEAADDREGHIGLP